MTEVRKTAFASGCGLFASKEYDTGDVILEEAAPLIVLAPVSTAQAQAILLNHGLAIPNDVVEEEDQSPSSSLLLMDYIDALVDQSACCCNTVKDDRVKVRAMVQAALCFVYHESSSDTASSLSLVLELYHPPLTTTSTEDPPTKAIHEDERHIVQLSLQAMKVLETMISSNASRNKTKGRTALQIALSRTTEEEGNGFLNRAVLQKIMLIWACNAFAGGRVYHQFSRINHSCNPNAVIRVDHKNHDSEKQTLVAAAPIAVQEEITISYLSGTWLWADTPTRTNILQRDKFFPCACARCGGDTTGNMDIDDQAQQIPCPACHPRTARQLSDDDQYDDELDVQYVCPRRRIRTSTNSSTSDVVVMKCKTCDFCFHPKRQDTIEVTGDDDGKQTEYEKIFQTNQSVVDKVVRFLFDYEEKETSHDGNKDVDKEQLLEQYLGMARAVLGAKHWATNALMLLQLDHMLASIHAQMLLSETTAAVSATKDEGGDGLELRIAEAIDLLERIVRFVEGLDLKLHMGHWLAPVVVGTARALVSLGDVKSRSYASEWLDKIAVDYVEKFESDGIKKVVGSLALAWQRTQQEGEDDGVNRAEKRAKR